LRSVFDTNVLISALLWHGSAPSLALDRARKESVLLVSAEALDELGDVLRRERFRRYAREETVQDFVLGLANEAEWVVADIPISACRDPKDDKFLSLAVSGGATHIVTGDLDLLALDPFQGIRIISPRQFLEL
jgi:uncharacterized protein